MEPFSLALQIHIGGAIVLALLLLTTIGSQLRSDIGTGTYKTLAVLLAVTTLTEILTGSAMFLLANDSSLVAFCGKMAIYLTLTAVAEYTLLRRIRALAVIGA